MADTPVPLNKSDGLMALGLAVLVLLGGSWRMAPGVCGVFHDDAIYVSTAQALARGEGYRLIGVPGAPPQTKYPFLYPALLATVWRLWPSFPDNLIAMKGLTLLSGAAAVAIAYLYLVRFGYFPRTVAAAAGAVCATSPYFLYFCTLTMAEMPFTLLTVIVLWGLDHHLRGPTPSRRAQVGLGALMALPFLCRVIGAVFIPVGLWLLFRSRRPLRWCLAGVAAASLPWVLWSLAGRGVWDRNPVDGYYTDYVGCWSSTGVQMFGRVLSWNTLLVAHGSAELCLEGLAAAAEPYLSPVPRHVLLIGLGVVSWLALVPQVRQGLALPWTMGAYLLVILVWSWPPYRFLVPILPFLAAYLLAGLAVLLRRPGARTVRRIAAAVGLSVLVLANAVLLGRQAHQTQETGYPPMKMSDARVAWSSHQRVFAWLRLRSRPEDVVSCGLDSMVSLYTDLQAFRPFVYNPGRLFYGQGPSVLLTPEELASILKRHRPRYLVQMPMPGFAEEKPFEEVLGRLRRQYPGWLVPVYQDTDPRFVVFELDPQYER
jgi:hypothetical protein